MLILKTSLVGPNSPFALLNERIRRDPERLKNTGLRRPTGPVRRLLRRLTFLACLAALAATAVSSTSRLARRETYLLMKTREAFRENFSLIFAPRPPLPPGGVVDISFCIYNGPG